MTRPKDEKQRLRAILWCAVSSEEQATSEKVSLAEQEALLRERAAVEQWDIIDVLVVPGFSRRFYNFPEFAAAARAVGLDAPDRLWEHWQRRDFDVLACRYGSRFAREQSIFGEVVSRTIDIGARIFTLQDGWVDRSNHRFFISMGGYTASAEIDKLMQAHIEGRKSRAARGLPNGSKTSLSHKLIRDEAGRAVRLEVDESYRRLWNDLAVLLLEGVAWQKIELALFDRYGHGRDGKPYPNHTFYELLYRPTFWGNSGVGYDTKPLKARGKMWRVEPGTPVPDQVTIHYGTHEPVYTGELGERIKAELRRRAEIITGTMSPRSPHLFSGLVVCGECGHSMSYVLVHHTNPYYRCVSRYVVRHYPSRVCEQPMIRERTVTEWCNDWMSPALATLDVGRLFNNAPRMADTTLQLTSEIEKQEKLLRGLIRDRASAEGTEYMLLDQEVKGASGLLNTLNRRLTEESQRTAQQALVMQRQQRALTEIAGMGIHQFWEQDTRVVHQIMVQLLGNYRFMALDQEVIGIQPRD